MLAHSTPSVASDYMSDGTYKLCCDRAVCKYAVHAKQNYGAIIWWMHPSKNNESQHLKNAAVDHLEKCVLSPWTDAATQSCDNNEESDSS